MSSVWQLEVTLFRGGVSKRINSAAREVARLVFYQNALIRYYFCSSEGQKIFNNEEIL